MLHTSQVISPIFHICVSRSLQGPHGGSKVVTLGLQADIWKYENERKRRREAAGGGDAEASQRPKFEAQGKAICRCDLQSRGGGGTREQTD